MNVPRECRRHAMCCSCHFVLCNALKSICERTLIVFSNSLIEIGPNGDGNSLEGVLNAKIVIVKICNNFSFVGKCPIFPIVDRCLFGIMYFYALLWIVWLKFYLEKINLALFYWLELEYAIKGNCLIFEFNKHHFYPRTSQIIILKFIWCSRVHELPNLLHEYGLSTDRFCCREQLFLLEATN